MISNFDKNPVVRIDGCENQCWSGWDDICAKINEKVNDFNKKKIIVVIDCYHGVYHEHVKPELFEKIKHSDFIVSTDYFLSEEEIKEMIYPDVTDDRIFGFITQLTIDQYFDKKALQQARDRINSIANGVVIIYGEGAAYMAEDWDILLYADMARWEIQQRFRRNEISNLGGQNRNMEFSLQYKQGYFVDWRVCDRHKQGLMDQWDFVLDSNDKQNPKMVTGVALLQGLEKASKQPFRVVPFFDPGPWGGQWMKEVFDLDKSEKNYAWCFDCVPEENSLLLGFGDQVIEVPSINLVFKHPMALLGEHVVDRFGKEFPIRFDFLDTMEGGNLSLQVHPTNEYIKEQFGMDYTQDESYYMLDTGQDAIVYLGLKENIEPQKMIDDLYKAQKDGSSFDADKYVQKWPVKKHDHILIPAGTVHCSGKNSMVLEVSATPYIFTFKLWDWGRMGMDGKPRPINIKHGENVIDWGRTKDWTEKNIVNRTENVGEGDGWIEERTGLHETQFIETRRHWFTKKVYHNTNGGVNVLNLIEGRQAIVESPSGAFQPYIIHYAETFIVPAVVGEYTISPHGESCGSECATLKAFVRN
jgi:mannose-6-phosphate isomerase class I